MSTPITPATTAASAVLASPPALLPALINQPIAFIGGGNMASAIIGGLLQQGMPSSQLEVVEPWAEASERLKSQFGVVAHAQPGPALQRCAAVVWAVKPQTFRDAAHQARPWVAHALQLSVAAGIRSDSIAQWLGTGRIVRSMPNTPALVGQGMTGLFAREAVTSSEKALVESIVRPTGQYLWLEQESDLDTVTALSGSGPAYVFYFIEAMVQAGMDMGLPAQQARNLAVATFAGAAELARLSTEPPAVLRERVTSKGGTTYAAITALEQADVKNRFIDAMKAAQMRAKELGDEFGVN